MTLLGPTPGVTLIIKESPISAYLVLIIGQLKPFVNAFFRSEKDQKKVSGTFSGFHCSCSSTRGRLRPELGHYLDSPLPISRWPVTLNTTANSLDVRLGLRPVDVCQPPSRTQDRPLRQHPFLVPMCIPISLRAVPSAPFGTSCH